MNIRNPILSFILSFVFTGLGQVYNGELKKGILFAILIFPVYILVSLTGLLSSIIGLILITSLIIFYKLAVAIEAYRKSRSLNPYELKPINKVGKYLLFIFFGFAASWIGVSTGKALIGYEAFEIPTPSMEPTIKVGDRVMATRVKSKNIKLGDIVTFTKEDGQKYLSRVIGLPGDTVGVINNKASINGQIEKWEKDGTENDNEIESQRYKCKLPSGKEFGTLEMLRFNGHEIPMQEISNKEQFVVEVGKIYVLGDNRNNTMDSRMYGTVPIENVEKIVNYIWWSKETNRIGIILDE